VTGTRPLNWSLQHDDLAFLKPLLQDKRIVALGESGHGVAQFNAIKVRMIKYLHEQLGYNLVAFEAPMAECAAADRMIGSDAPEKVMRKCLFRVWHTSETAESLDYVAKARAAGRDLHITGFDIQDKRLQPGAMDSVKHALGPDQADLMARLERAETALLQIRAQRSSAAEAAELTDVYTTVAGILGDHGQRSHGVEAEERAFLRMQMLSRVALVAMSVAPMGSREALETRDAAMAAHFNYLMQQRHPGKKVIVWGHNAHVAKKWPVPQHPRMMGSHLADSYGKSLYVVGLVMGRGQAANNMGQAYDVAQPDPASIEGAFAGAAVKMGFLDLTSNKASWMSAPVMTRDWGRHPMLITPDASFDGLLYIDTVTPPKYL
jgi:erythromycin esterase